MIWTTVRRCTGSIKIETYWNVNTTYDVEDRETTWIKIETYWNVNCRVPA